MAASNHFEDFKTETDQVLLEPYYYTANSGGKGVRKQLALAFNHWFEVPSEKLESIVQIIEMLHNSSLVIDDIEDNSLLRRGQPVAYKIFGLPLSINSANMVYFIALKAVLGLDHPEATKIYTEQMIELHRGQGMELHWRDSHICPTFKQYNEMVIRKTGGLFGMAIKLMQLFSSVEMDFKPLLDNLGLLFQIRDDYINLFDDEYQLAKCFCEDLTEGKYSFPIVHAIQSRPGETIVSSILRQRTSDVDVKKFCVNHLKTTGSQQYTLDTLKRIDSERVTMVGFMNWWHNEGSKYIFLLLWHGLNVGLFVYAFIIYYTQPQYFYLRRIIGLGLPFARGAAMSLNFNCMLILFPACRNLTTLLRNAMSKWRHLDPLTRLLDRGITFHRNCAYVICFFTAIHIGAHVTNVEKFVDAWKDPTNKTSGLLTALLVIPDAPVIVRQPRSWAVLEVVKLLAGVSGILMTIALIILVASSTELHRRYFFNRFWISHHLFVIFIVGMIVHGMQGVIRFQLNTKEHDPEVCNTKYAEWGTTKAPECPLPTFASGSADSWKFLVVPVLFYILERILRFVRSLKTVTVKKIQFHPSRVFELQLLQSGFSSRPGQYIFINCPQISFWEWHPFTLTSAPDDDFFSVHIRCAGDWTNALHKMLKECADKGNPYPRFCIDGPFGTASEHVFRYPVAVLIGTGIGVTPFASILRNISHLCNNAANGMNGQLQKVYLYWICPDYLSFEWFGNLLRDLESNMHQTKPDFITFQIFLTRGWDGEKTKELISNEFEEKDQLTGLQQKTHFGRPNFSLLLKKMTEKHANESIGVFFCGPSVLSKEIHGLCNSLSTNKENGTKFFYSKENF